MSFHIFYSDRENMGSYAGYSLLTFVPLFIGFLFGVPFAVIRRFHVPFAAGFMKNASNILKGIPAVLLVLMINYLILKPIDYLALSYEWAKPLQTMDKIYIGIAALSIYAVVQITETVLGALLSVGKGQYEAAYSVGLTRTQILLRVIFPPGCSGSTSRSLQQCDRSFKVHIHCISYFRK